MPSAPNPAGPAIAARSHRLAKLVNVPSRAFGPTGLAASSASVGHNGAVGSNSASYLPNNSAASRRTPTSA